MAMVDTVYWLPIGGPAAQAGWLGLQVSSYESTVVSPFIILMQQNVKTLIA